MKRLIATAAVAIACLSSLGCVFAPEEPVEDCMMIHEDDTYSKNYSDSDVRMIARLMYDESYGVVQLATPYGERDRAYQMKCVAWCVLNRLDMKYGGQETVAEVITAPYQFAYNTYRNKQYETVQSECEQLAHDVLNDWASGNESERTLPAEYIYFTGNGYYNTFRDAKGNKYEWELH